MELKDVKFIKRDENIIFKLRIRQKPYEIIRKRETKDYFIID